MKTKVHQIEQFILENISNYNFSVEMLAQQLHMSTSHLRETSYCYFFMSPQKLIESFRLQKAILLFKKGLSIECVKIEIGYLHSRTFRRVFKKRLHITPSACKDILNRTRHKDRTIKQLLAKLWSIQNHI